MINILFSHRPTILIIDSGVGGLSIYLKISKILPNANYIYFFDNEGFPYGTKNNQFIIKRIIKIINTMIELHNINLIILACITATIVALNIVQKKFTCPIIGTTPEIKKGSTLTRNGIIGLITTHTTMHQKYIINLINFLSHSLKILTLSSSIMVNIAENKIYGKLINNLLLKNIFMPWIKLLEPPDVIVLGCTHFSFLKYEINYIMPYSTIIIDSTKQVVYNSIDLLNKTLDITQCLDIYIGNKAYCSKKSNQVIEYNVYTTKYNFSSLDTVYL